MDLQGRGGLAGRREEGRQARRYGPGAGPASRTAHSRAAAEGTAGDGLRLPSQAPGLTVPLSDSQNCRLSRSLLEYLHFYQLPWAPMPLAGARTLSSTPRAVTTPSPEGPTSCLASPTARYCSRLLFSTKTSKDGSFTLLPGHQLGGVAQASKGVTGDVQTGVEGGGFLNLLHSKP